MSVGQTPQNADKQFANLRVTDHLPAKNVTGTQATFETLVVGNGSNLGPTSVTGDLVVTGDSTVGGNSAVVGDLTVSGDTTLASFSTTTAVVDSSALTGTTNTGISKCVVEQIANVISIFFMGAATGSAATLGTLAAAYRPSATVTSGSMMVVPSALPAVIRTLSLSTAGVITPSAAFASGDVYSGQIRYLL